MYVLNHYDAHMKLIQYSVNYISIKKKRTTRESLCNKWHLTMIPNYHYTVFKKFYLSNKVLNIHLKYSTQKD